MYKYDGNLQGLFTYIYNKMIEQGKPAMHNGDCVYLSPEGLQCAVGCLFTPEQAKPLRGNLYDDTVIAALAEIGIPDPAIPLLRKLQLAHDNSCHKPNWVEAFKTSAAVIAKEFGLKIPKKEPGPHTKRFWSNLFRKTAKLLESGEITHIQGWMNWKNETFDGCCLVGAMHRCEPTVYGSAWGFNDNVPYNVKKLFNEVSEQQYGFTGFNDHLPNDQVVVDGLTHYVVKPEETKRVCRILRKVARLLEHGGAAPMQVTT